MAAARVALALVLVASAVQTGRAEPCAPRAELAGDAEAVARVAVELERLGVDVRTDGGASAIRAATRCPVIAAAVELDRGGGIAVAVRDATQRSEGRVVSDAALAAAWIDSWLRDDFTAPNVEAPVIVQPPAAVAPRLRETSPPPVEPVLDRFALAASFLQIWSEDSTRWSGVAASACVRAGELCIGGRLGYARQDVTADLTAAARRDLSLLATASYAQDVGTMSIAPELGLGVGRLTTSRIEGCKTDPGNPMMCDPTTMNCEPIPMPTCDPNAGIIHVGDNFSTATYTPRVSAALRIAIPLFEHVWLDGLAAATLAPFAHTDDYAGANPDGTTMPNTGNVAFPLPGDPLYGIQLGIGLRVGAR